MPDLKKVLKQSLKTLRINVFGVGVLSNKLTERSFFFFLVSVFLFIVRIKCLLLLILFGLCLSKLIFELIGKLRLGHMPSALT